MLITDEIRDKMYNYFVRSLSQELWKYYNEFFALAVLRYIEPNRFSDFSKADAPDLQCISSMSGIEVTMATIQKMAAISGDYSKYGSTQDKQQKSKLKDKIEKNHGRVDEYGGVSYPVITLPMEYDAIRDAINNKNKKISSYKEKGFEDIGLFVIYESPLMPSWTEDRFQQLFEEAKGNPAYDVIYLCSSRLLFSYRYADKTFMTYSIPKEDYESLGVIARLTVEGALDMESPVWRES